jgi:alkylhydroperoxidase family enzyme
MKYIPRMEKEDAEPEAHEVWKELSFDLAIFHIFAHAPAVFDKWRRLNRELQQGDPTEIPKLYNEIAIVYASVLSDSSYEWANHGSQLLRAGGTQAQIDALVARNPDADVFDESQKLIIRFTAEIVEDARPTEATLTAMSEEYPNKDIVKLTTLICYYMMNSRIGNLGGLVEGDDEDYGMFHLGRKTKDEE